MKYCQNCELEYDDKFSFCKKCGSKLEVKEEKKACSKCGKELSAESGFCPFCGTEVKQNKTNVENSISLDNDNVSKDESINTNKNNIEGTTDVFIKDFEDKKAAVNDQAVNKNSQKETVKPLNNEKRNDIPVKKIVVYILAVSIVICVLVYDKALKDEEFKYQLYDMGFLRFLSAEEQFDYAYKLSKEQEYEKAYIWYKISADNGFAPSQNNLGVMYAKGHGVEKNEKEAFKWYLKAAKQGDDVAQCNVGRFYYYGRGIDKDTDEAKKWLRKASAQGNKDAGELFNLIKRTELWEKSFPK